MLIEFQKHPKGERGIALVAAILITVVLLVLALPLMDVLRNEIVVTGAHGRSNAALRAAYLGVEEMTYQFEINDAGLAPGVVPATQTKSYPNLDGSTTTYTTTVDPIRWTSNLPTPCISATASKKIITAPRTPA